MPFLEILLMSFGMAMDAFAVCLATGSLPQLQGTKPALRIAFHFGLFQFIMPILGWLVGVTVEPLIQDLDHWIAFCLLAFVGGRMIYSSRQISENKITDPSRGWALIVLSVAVSIDALAVGLSLGLLRIFVGYPAVLIGVVTGLMSLVGLQLGNRVGARFGREVQIVGGIVLIGIGVRIVLEHLAAG